MYNSTEIYEAGVGFQSGPSIPMATFQHCIVKINTTHIFTVGGFPYTRFAFKSFVFWRKINE